MKTSSRLVSLAVILTGASPILGCSFIKSHFRTADYPSGSVGATVNERFTEVVRNCQVVPASEQPKPEDFDGFDFVPDGLRGKLRSSEFQATPMLVKMHPSSLFLYPFTDAEKAGFLAPANGRATPALDEQHVLSEKGAHLLGLGVDVVPGKKPGLDAFVQRYSCASYMSVKAEAGVSLPVASFKSALQAQNNNGGRAHVAGGFFVSPFLAMLQSGDRGLYARLLLWEQYRQTPVLVSSKAIYALNSFNGVAVMTATARSEDSSVQAGADASYAGGPASVSAALSARYEEATSYQGEAFRTMVVRITDSNFTPLPSPAEIASWMQDSFARAIVEPTVPMKDGQWHEHRFVLPGVPRDTCEGSTWTMTEPPSGATTSGTSVPLYATGSVTILAKAGVQPESGLPACSFIVRGKPNAAAFPMPSPPPVSYKITGAGTVQVGEAKIALGLTVGGFQFKMSPSPQVTISDAAFRPEPFDQAATTVRLKWVLPINIHDADNPVVRDKDAPLEAAIEQLRCASGSVNVKASVGYNEQSGQSSVSVTAVDPISPPAAGYRTEACRADITVRLPLAGGGYVARTVSTLLDRPTPVPSAPGPAPNNVAQKEATSEFLKGMQAQERFLKQMRSSDSAPLKR